MPTNHQNSPSLKQKLFHTSSPTPQQGTITCYRTVHLRNRSRRYRICPRFRKRRRFGIRAWTHFGEKILVRFTSPNDANRAVRRMQQVNPDNVLADILTAVDHGRTDPRCNGSVILLGICFGGKFAWRAASKTPIQALAAWHGGGMLADIKQNTLAAIHVELDFGEADPHTASSRRPNPRSITR